MSILEQSQHKEKYLCHYITIIKKKTHTIHYAIYQLTKAYYLYTNCNIDKENNWIKKLQNVG